MIAFKNWIDPFVARVSFRQTYEKHAFQISGRLMILKFHKRANFVNVTFRDKVHYRNSMYINLTFMKNELMRFDLNIKTIFSTKMHGWSIMTESYWGCFSIYRKWKYFEKSFIDYISFLQNTNSLIISLGLVKILID